MFEHTFEVKLNILGCAGALIYKNFTTEFIVGDKAYIKQKARLGKLEKIIIKKLLIDSKTNYRSLPAPLYVDHFNRIWEESELLNQETAIDISLIYWKNISEETKALFKTGVYCFPISD